MEYENKPSGADVVEESGQEEFQGGSLEGTELDDLFETGEENVENGAEATLTLADLNNLAGRTGNNAFKSVADFNKHYGHLNSFVGKKEEKLAPKIAEAKPTGDYVSRSEIESILAEREFVSSNPTAKEHLDILKAVAKDRGISVNEAYEAVKDTLEAASAFKKERTVGVNSKNRINPMQSQRLTKLAANVKAGDARSEEALVEEFFKQ